MSLWLGALVTFLYGTARCYTAGQSPLLQNMQPRELPKLWTESNCYLRVCSYLIVNALWGVALTAFSSPSPIIIIIIIPQPIGNPSHPLHWQDK